MRKFSITDAKNNLSALIDGLKSGSPVLIVDRGRPVARLEAVPAAVMSDDGRLARLVREGVVRPGRRGKPARKLLTDQPPDIEGGASAVAALLQERREGR